MKRPVFLSLLFILFGICLTHLANGQKKKNQTNLNEFIKIKTDSIFDKLIKVRRHIHQNPELAGKEKHTQEYIKQYLLGLGLEVRTDIYGYGIVGILKGAQKGKQVAWRSDMDALPNDFPDNTDFKSQTKGVEHGCGHDIHIAIALGIAEVLAKNKNALHGTVYFIFSLKKKHLKEQKT